MKPAVKITRPRDQKKTAQPIELRAYSVDQFAAAYGISRAYVYRLVKEGKLKTAMVGKRRIITIDAAEDYIASVTS